MLYYATPSGPSVVAAMQAGLLACITTPAQGNRVPDGTPWAADNGKFGKGWPGSARWYQWLTDQTERYGSENCSFAVAPDVPFSAHGTLAESLPWLPAIRALGLPIAFAAQDGSEKPGLIPWDYINTLFIAGSTAWKTGPSAQLIAMEAKGRGLSIHMGRVNSFTRMRTAMQFGCTSCDGTMLTYGPDVNLGRLLRWLDRLRREPPHTPEPGFAQGVNRGGRTALEADQRWP